MMPAKARKPLFQRLREGLEEGIAHVRGELTLKTIDLPEAPPEVDAKTVTALREAARMSQSVFAKLLFVSPKTVQSWEQGVRVPSMAARRLIQIFAERPDAVCQIVGIPEVRIAGFRTQQVRNGKRRIVQAASGRGGR